MAAKQWYYREANGAEYGPFSGVELRRLVQLGRVRRETLVRTDTSDRSIAASQVKGLFPEWETGAVGTAPAAAPGQAYKPGGDPGFAYRAKPGRLPETDPIEEIDDRGYPQSRTQGPITNNVFAIASLISGILGWTIVPVVGAAAAIITGHIALRQIERSNGREDGKIMAVIGLILGYIEAVLLFVVTISLFFLGIGIAGFLSLIFHQAEREARQRGMNPPKVERPRAFAPFAPPNPRFGDNSREGMKALEYMEERGRDGDAEGASRREGPEDRIAMVPRGKAEEPPFELEGSWDVTGPRLRGAYIIEFATNGAVNVRHAYCKSSIASWSYRDGSILLGGSIRVNEIKVQGPWKARWRSGDVIEVVDPDGQELTLKRRTP